MEDRALHAVVLQRLQRVGGGAVRRVQRHREIPAHGEIEQAVEPRAAPRLERIRVGRAFQRIPGQADLADAHDPRVMRDDLGLDPLEILVGELGPVGMESQARPDCLRRRCGRLERLGVGLGVAPDGDRAPHVVRHRQPQRLLEVGERRIVQVTVAVDDHRVVYQVPATTMRPILSVGATVRSRRTRSSPTPSIDDSISSRLPATVTSSTGYASSPFSIHCPTAPRE